MLSLDALLPLSPKRRGGHCSTFVARAPRPCVQPNRSNSLPLRTAGVPEAESWRFGDAKSGGNVRRGAPAAATGASELGNAALSALRLTATGASHSVLGKAGKQKQSVFSLIPMQQQAGAAELLGLLLADSRCAEARTVLLQVCSRGPL